MAKFRIKLNIEVITSSFVVEAVTEKHLLDLIQSVNLKTVLDNFADGLNVTMAESPRRVFDSVKTDLELIDPKKEANAQTFLVSRNDTPPEPKKE